MSHFLKEVGVKELTPLNKGYDKAELILSLNLLLLQFFLQKDWHSTVSLVSDVKCCSFWETKSLGKFFFACVLMLLPGLQHYLLMPFFT